MCNCGKKAQPRTVGTTVTPPAALVNPSPQKPPSQRTSVEFEYVGTTAMTVRGPFSGARYRFHYPGARLRVHPHDASSLAAIPNLQAVSLPKE